jgi:hypothetical protein
MRTVRLGRQFDAVFVHDAVMYMTTEADLRQAMETAYVHCRPGGAALFAPDWVRETFQSGTDHGGLEWTWDPDESESMYTVDYADLLRQADGTVTVEHDRHVEGLFARGAWQRWLEAAGFEVKIIPDAYNRDLFLGLKR